MLNEKQIKYLIENKEKLIYRDFLLSTFTPKVDDEDVAFKIPFRSEFILHKDMIENYDGPPIVTNIGQFIGNYIIFVWSLGNRIPYVNEDFTNHISAIENQIADDMVSTIIEPDFPEEKHITVPMYGKYVNALTYYAHMSLLGSSSYSPKSLTIDPAIPKRAKELYKKHEHELDDNQVVYQIEKELIDMYKDYIKGDIGDAILKAIGEKAYNIHIKKTLITQGAIEDFGHGDKRSIVKNSLEEGWTPEDFVTLVNNSRKGSYSRAVDTALGGYLTKTMYRVFSSVQLTEDDCGTKKGLGIDNPENWIGRYILDNDKTVLLTNNNITKYNGKKVLLRSPYKCQTKGGYCYKCSLATFEALGTKTVVGSVAAQGSSILQSSMNAVHGTALSTTKINYKDFFVN
ncbi:MAG: hypothetical protein GY804_08530 [Alphaproteobacteria bacterium]|nr:hypothetical protein [Alphaproteobacteria bacterium]